MMLDARELESYVSNHQAETSTLDFKRERYSPRKRGDLLDDIVSLANSQGGFLVIGIEENDAGEAIAFCAVPDAGAERDWIMNVAKTGIQPPVGGLEATTVRIGSGEELVVVGVPRSSLRPHAAVEGDKYRYRIRRGHTNGWLSPVELKEMVLAVSSARARARAHLIARQDRAREMSAPQLLVQVLPIATEGEAIDLRNRDVRHLIYNPPEVVRGAFYRGGEEAFGQFPEQILEGRRIQTLRGELQVWFSGYIEYRAWTGGLFFGSDGQLFLHATHLGAAVCSAARFVDALYRKASLADECVVTAALMNVKGTRSVPIRDVFRFDLADFPIHEEVESIVERVVTLPMDSPDELAFELLARLAWTYGSDTVHGFEQATRKWSTQGLIQ